jgi:NADH-quinone oxidoreductase subunit L
MSQIGYMFLAVGLGAFGAGLFHLMTHAFFKALLFMAAGVVIHALAGEQDIRKMGGLGKQLPWTYRCFLVGALALAAIPPFAGFFSKDAILASAAGAGTLGWILWGVGITGAFLTALYTFRLVFIVFFGEPAADQPHLHKERFEGPLSMMWPVGVLTIGAIVSGFLQFPGGWAGIDTWIEPVAESIPEVSGGTAWFSALTALGLAIAGIVVAWLLYGRRRSEVPSRIRARLPWATTTLEHKLYFDEAYDYAFYEPSSRLALLLTHFVEKPIFLASLGEIGFEVREIGSKLAAAQNGLVRTYALAVAVGLAVILVVFLTVS